jgi:hypothetical protein
MAKAAVDEIGPEVIPSDDNDKQGDKATLTMPTKTRKGRLDNPHWHDFVRWQDGAWEGRQAMPCGDVPRNAGGREGRNAHSNAPHNGQ